MLKSFKGLGLAICLALATTGYADEILSRYEINQPTQQALDVISKHWEIVARHGRDFEVILPAKDVAMLQKLAPQARQMEADISSVFKQPASARSDLFAGYRDFSHVEASLRDLAAKYPDLMALTVYGHSTQGKPLYALKFSNNVKVDEGEPRILIDAGTHGDEIITVEVLMRLIEEMASQYGHNDRITRMVNSSEIVFIPVVNPDGFSRRQRYDNGVDPNREYPYPEVQDRHPVASIAALMSYIGDQDFKGDLTLHAYGQLVMYPWSYTNDPIEDTALRDQYDLLTHQMAANNHYQAGQISNILYVAKGSSSDYYLWKHNMFSIAVEMATTKAPPTAGIPAVMNENREMLYLFIEHFLAAGSHS